MVFKYSSIDCTDSFLSLGTSLALRLALALGCLGESSITLTLLPPDLAFMALIRIVKALLVLVAELDIVLLDIRAVQFHSTQLASNLLVLLGLEPCSLGSRHNLVTVLHQVLTLGELHLSLGELLFGLLFLQDLGDLVSHVLGLLGPAVGNSLLDDTTGNLGTLGFTGPDGELDDLAVWLGGDSACTTRTTGTGCTTNTMQIDLVALGGFVVNDGFDTLDIQTTGRNVGGKKEGDLAVSEVFNGCDTLRVDVSMDCMGRRLFDLTCSWLKLPCSSAAFRPSRPKIIRMR